MMLKLLVGLGVVTAGACAPFPKGPALIGYDPTPYADAFGSAATEAVLSEALGRNVYEAFGDEAYRLSRDMLLCSPDTLPDFVAQRLQAVSDPTCKERDLCLSFRMDGALARDPKVFAAVETALRQPCKALTQPRNLPYGAAPSIIGVPARASWRLLQCGGGLEVVGSEATRTNSGDTVILRLRFALARVERKPQG